MSSAEASDDVITPRVLEGPLVRRLSEEPAGVRGSWGLSRSYASAA